MNFLKNFFLLIITILFISNFDFSNEKNYFLSNKIKRVNDALTEENIENRKQTTIKLKKTKYLITILLTFLILIQMI